MKKIVSIILVAMMIVTILPVSIFAAEASVVEIDTAEEFYAIKDNLSGSYKLTADITVTTGISYGNEGALFTGTFDGNGKTITLNMEDPNSQRSALFCSVGACTIKNLTVKGYVNSRGNSAGGLIGTVKGDNNVINIDHVTMDVDILNANNSDNGQGGFIGAIEDKPTVNFTNCTNKGDISGEVVGGFVGKTTENSKGAATVKLTDCVNEGDITVQNRYADKRGAGGFFGAIREGTFVTMTNCTNKGDITGIYVNAGAYAGYNHIQNINNKRYTVTNCKNEGKVVSGGYELPTALATGNMNSVWGNAGSISFNADTMVLTGAPEFDVEFDCTDYETYVNGTKVDADKATVTNKGNRKFEFSVDATGLVDGVAAVTFVWKDGTYSTYGVPAPAKADYAQKDFSAALIEKVDKIDVDNASVAIENTLLANDGSEHDSKNTLFDGNRTNKYEGWKQNGKTITVSFQIAEAKKIGFYSIGTGGDDANYPDRQPTVWKLYGSVDGTAYDVIASVDGANQPDFNNIPSVYATDKSDVAYKFFKLELITFTSEAANPNGEKWYVQIGEIELFGLCDHTYGEPVVDAGNCTKDTTTTKTCTVCGHEDVKVDAAPGHDFVDGKCSVCSTPDPDVAPETKPVTTPAPTGDVITVMIALSVVAMAAIAVVISKKRSYQN